MVETFSRSVRLHGRTTNLGSLIFADMSNNPLANELNYRLRVIWAMPSLKVLDRHMITFEERLRAEKLAGASKVSSFCFMKRKPLWKNEPAPSSTALSVLSKEMYKELAATHKAQDEATQVCVCLSSCLPVVPSVRPPVSVYLYR